MRLLSLIIACLMVSSIACREICYQDLGCFINTQPFGGTTPRPIAVLPDTPQKIATKFMLYKRDLSASGVAVSYASLSDAFDPNLKTVLIIHGFIDNTPKPWMFDIKNAILQVENVNVIIVDWTKGNQFPYTQATANTQVVGAEIARLIQSAISNRGFKAENFHLVGHSLGAHISGYAGSRVRGLGRITGIDPAGPYFENTDPIVRLDPTDALYVDAIHTDGASTLKLGFGLMQPVGHADYYPNGGKSQPDCKATSDKLLGAVFSLLSFDMSGAEDAVKCNHVAGQAYFIESIYNRNCLYNSFKCNSKDDFDNGNCLVCSSKGCNQMGYWSSPEKEQGTLYLNTLSPNLNTYCTQSYKVKLVSNSLFSSAKGTFKLYMKTAGQSSKVQILGDSSEYSLKADQVDVRVLSFGETKLTGMIESVFVSYSRTGNIFTQWFYDSQWSFRSIEVFSGDDQVGAKYCPTSDKIGSDFVEFKRC